MILQDIATEITDLIADRDNHKNMHAYYFGAWITAVLGVEGCTAPFSDLKLYGKRWAS